MIQVSIIIINYNTAQWVKSCVNSIQQFTQGVSFDIWIVDNQSTERAIESLLASFTEINFIQLPKNIGFGAACNVAASRAMGDYFLFLNPDTKFLNNAISLFYNFWTQNNEKLNLACIGALLQQEDGTIVHSFGRFPQMSILVREKLKSIGKHFLHSQSSSTRVTFSDFEAYQQVDYVTGADLFISRQNFELVQGFDERFFMYFEETDLQWRLAKFGKNAFVIKGPKLQHIQGASLKGNKPLMRVFYFNSLLQYFKIRKAKWQFLTFKFLWCILDAKTLYQKICLSLKSKN